MAEGVSGATIYTVLHQYDDGESYNDQTMALFSTRGQAETMRAKLAATSDPKYNTYTIVPMTVDADGDLELLYVAYLSVPLEMRELPKDTIQVGVDSLARELTPAAIIESGREGNKLFARLDINASGWTEHAARARVFELFEGYYQGNVAPTLVID